MKSIQLGCGGTVVRKNIDKEMETKVRNPNSFDLLLILILKHVQAGEDCGSVVREEFGIINERKDIPHLSDDSNYFSGYSLTSFPRKHLV